MKESTFGEQIAHARKEKKLTQAQLAQKFGITDKAVSKWERNLSKPDAIILPELVEFLGLPKESLSDAVRLSGRYEKPTTYETQKNRTEKSCRSVFLEVMRHEFCRIFCVSIMIACVVCFFIGDLSIEISAITFGCAITLFAFLTLLKI